MYDIINNDMKYKVTEGDCVVMYETNWNDTKRVGKPYKAIVLWCDDIGGQPLITNCDEYRPRWSTYEHIVDIVGHVDLKTLLKDFNVKEKA